MKAIVIVVDNDDHVVAGLQATNPALFERGVLIVNASEVKAQAEDVIPDPIKELSDKVLKINPVPIVDTPVLLRDKKPFQRSNNKYMNKRKHRRH